MTTTARPVQPAERIAEIDIVRGIALLGIFIMNMPAFNQSFFAGADGSHVFNAWYDRGVEEFREVLFSGKFNSMFSFLFAVGFTIQLGRLQASEPGAATGIYVRRLLILLLLGVVHACVFWPGDVLHIYAFLGLFLLGMRNLTDRTVVAIVIASLFLPTVGNLLLLPQLTPEYLQRQMDFALAWASADEHIFRHGTFFETARRQAQTMRFSYSEPLAIWSMAKFYLEMTTTMCLGLLAGRHLWLQNVTQHMDRVRRIQWLSLGVGLVAAALFFIGRLHPDPLHIHPYDFVAGFSYRLCRVALMVFYVTSVLRLAQVPVWRRRFAPIAYAGRMPLTNYLMQTAMATAIFYGWGLGYWGRTGPLASLLLAFALWALVQLPLSTWWFGRFRFGPLEYLWRAATYGRLPHMRQALEAA